MALKHVNPNAASNGDGDSYDTAYNTFAGLTWGANTYKVYPGTLRETVTFGAGSNGAKLLGSDASDKPVIDCENTRASGVNLNSRVGCEVANIRVINQNAAVPNAGIRVTGSAHHIHHNETFNCQAGIHVNVSASNRIEHNYIDCGNPLTPTIAYGIRVNGAAATANIVRRNTIRSTATGMTFMSSIQMYETVSGGIYYNDVQCPIADGPALFRASDCYLVGNFSGGSGMLDCLIVDASSSCFVYGNTTVHFGDVAGHFGPAFKMGSITGDPGEDNDVANNVFISLGANNCMNLVTIGAGNTFKTNHLWRPSGGNIVNLNTGSGVSALTFAQWLAAGLTDDDTFGDPLLTDTYRPRAGSPLLGAGTHLGYTRDIEGKQRPNPPSIGAYDVATLRTPA
jgi:hypothetical protein